MKKGSKGIMLTMARTCLLGLGLSVALTGATAATALLLSAPAAHAQVKRTLKLGLNKSAVVRLPAGIRDVLVGNPKVADVVLRSKRTMYIFAKKTGQTNIFLLGADGNPKASLDVVVSIDPAPLRRMLKKVLPDANIRVESIGDQIILSGSAKTPAEVNKAVQLAEQFVSSDSAGGAAAEAQNQDGQGENGGGQPSSGQEQGASKSTKVINAVRITGKDQVMIKVKVAEIQRSVLKQLRTNFSQINFDKGNLTGAIGLVFPFSLGNSTAIASQQLNGLDTPGGIGTFSRNNTTVQTYFQALERDGLVRLLAEPTLTAISGESAKFMAGGEVPVITGYDPVMHTYIYKFKPFGVLLGFTPLVLSEGRISLKMSVEVSELSSRYQQPINDGKTVIPGFEKRKTETTVELPSGGTLAIAGMIHEQTKQNIDGLPGLKNLPVLGALFRSRDFQANQTELVVMATPYIVRPVNEKRLRTPIDRLNIASDYQTFFLGRLQRVYGATGDDKGSGEVYHGDVGFFIQ